ncbi:MAG: hypothetical protein MUF00_03615 [Gemmatimonadaceae bacterium]|jgi:hypothetical protein|nr:hypothetical protein [Gemmatimonadaceae bacterium]
MVLEIDMAGNTITTGFVFGTARRGLEQIVMIIPLRDLVIVRGDHAPPTGCRTWFEPLVPGVIAATSPK